jgi:meso-butanediol dehydrogenase/(S,S)-butanediol dehydrogenase/diacetyl reductase
LGRTLTKLQKLAAELGPAALAVECDVGQPDSVRSAFTAIARQHPRVDVLINNAAIYEPFFVRDATDGQIDAALRTNLAGPIYCSRAAIPVMERGAQIINISTDTVASPYAMFSLYQSTKAGLERFTSALRTELEPAGIRVSLMRAGPMYDQDSAWRVDPATVKRFAEENLKRGIDSRKIPVSTFESAARAVCTLMDLPADLEVTTMWAEGHRD